MAIDKGWTDLRERQAERGTREVFDELPVCLKCHDWGFWTVIFPNGYNAIHLCDCKKGHERWGSACYEEMNSRTEDLWWDDMRRYFGGESRKGTQRIMDQYELVKRPDKYPKCEVIMEYKRKG